MPAYVIEKQDADHVLCHVTMDDGSTFGQYVTGDARLTMKGIDGVVQAAIQRHLADTAVPKVPEAAIAAAVMTAVPVTVVQPIQPMTLT
jgi:hypothetical protein